MALSSLAGVVALAVALAAWPAPAAGSTADPTDAADPADPAAARWRLDASFGTDGITFLDSPAGPYLEGGEVVVQPDGRVVVGSNTYRDEITVLRFLPDGELDPSFGNGGFATVRGQGSGTSLRVALQQVGDQTKIVLLGSGSRKARLWRLNPDGSLDTTHDADPDIVFGNRGVVRYAMPDLKFAYAPSLHVAADGSLILATLAERTMNARPAVVRLLRDGAPDTSFGTNGTRTLAMFGGFREASLTTSPDGSPRILAAGFRSDGSDYRWLVAAFDLSGRRDPAYGSRGLVEIRPPDDSGYCRYREIRQVLPLDSGGALLNGRSCAGEADPFAALVRLDGLGQVDTDYGDDGWAYPVAPGAGDPVAGKVDVAPTGHAYWNAGSQAESDPLITGGVRPDGATDPRFGPDGYLTVELPNEGELPADNRIGDIALDREGRLLFSATMWVDGDPKRLVLVRLTSERTAP